MRHIDKPMGLADGRWGERVEPGSTLLNPVESTVVLTLANIAVVGLVAGLAWGGSTIVKKAKKRVKKAKKRTA